MDRFRKYVKDTLIMAGVLLASFLICLEMQKGTGTQHLIPAIPYFKFNFTMRDNLLSAFIMLTVTLITSTLTTKIRIREKLVADNEKEKLRSNLLRAISHDLRTPLTTIYGSSSAIVENYDKLSKEEQIELAKGIKQDSEWLTHMVENLLSVTRIDGKGVKLVKTAIVLDELIDSVLVKFRKRYPKQEILLELPDDFILIQMDPVLIEQVQKNNDSSDSVWRRTCPLGREDTSRSRRKRNGTSFGIYSQKRKYSRRYAGCFCNVNKQYTIRATENV